MEEVNAAAQPPHWQKSQDPHHVRFTHCIASPTRKSTTALDVTFHFLCPSAFPLLLPLLPTFPLSPHLLSSHRFPLVYTFSLPFTPRDPNVPYLDICVLWTVGCTQSTSLFSFLSILLFESVLAWANRRNVISNTPRDSKVPYPDFLHIFISTYP